MRSWKSEEKIRKAILRGTASGKGYIRAAVKIAFLTPQPPHLIVNTG